MNQIRISLDGAFQELVQKLAVEVGLYENLSKLLKAKQTSIIEGDVESLQNIVHEEQRLIPKIRMATQARELRATTIGSVSRLSRSTPSLKELIDLSPSHLTQQLVLFRESLIICLDQIAHANRENEFLLNSAVDLVRGLAMVLLGKDESDTVHYGGRGEFSENNTRRANIDCQG